MKSYVGMHFQPPRERIAEPSLQGHFRSPQQSVCFHQDESKHRTIAGWREGSYYKPLLTIQFCHRGENFRLTLMLHHIMSVMQIRQTIVCKCRHTLFFCLIRFLHLSIFLLRSKHIVGYLYGADQLISSVLIATSQVCKVLPL